MKKSILLLTAAACLLGILSCNKENVSQTPGPSPDGMLTVQVGPEAATKSAFAERLDFQISAVQIFVFDSAGKLETDYYSQVSPTSNPVSVSMATFTGAKTVYAVVNHKRLYLEKDYSITQFEAQTSDLKDNSPTKLVMVGKNTITVTEYDRNKNASATAQTLNIYVKRLAAMIVLDKITVDFSKTSLEDASFTIKDIYLKNVVAKCHLGLNALTGTPDADAVPVQLSDAEHSNANWWYNMFTKPTSGFIPPVTYDTWTHDCPEVAGGSGNALNRCLFAYPNRTPVNADSHDSAFSPRLTRLVIKAHVTAEEITPDAGVDTYYVFDLPVLQANRVYHIGNVVVTMLGKDNDNNDDDLQAGKVTPTITVDGWVDTSELNFEF